MAGCASLLTLFFRVVGVVSVHEQQNITMTHSERQSSNKLAGMRHCELLYDKLLARLQVYVDALDSDGDSPVKPMDDEMADALSELQANCHMPPKVWRGMWYYLGAT